MVVAISGAQGAQTGRALRPGPDRGDFGCALELVAHRGPAVVVAISGVQGAESRCGLGLGDHRGDFRQVGVRSLYAVGVAVVVVISGRWVGRSSSSRDGGCGDLGVWGSTSPRSGDRGWRGETAHPAGAGLVAMGRRRVGADWPWTLKGPSALPTRRALYRGNGVTEGGLRPLSTV